MTERIFGIDLARGLAILGMFILHALPIGSTFAGSDILLKLADSQRPQILFAVLDGVSLGIIASRGASNSQIGKAVTRRRIATRAVVLLALGLFLGTLGSGILVILDDYGFYFLILLPFLFVSSRVLVALAIPSLALGPLIVSNLQAANLALSSPGYLQQLLDWTLLGQYPAVVWIGYVLVGIIVSRLGFSNWRMQLSLALTSLLVAAAFWALNLLSLDSALAEVAQGVESLFQMVALIEVAVFLTPHLHRYRLLSPLMAIGAIPVTIYSLHVVSFALLADARGLEGVQSIPLFWISTACALLVAMLWLRRFGRGPVESLPSWLLGMPAPQACPHVESVGPKEVSIDATPQEKSY